MSIRNKTFDRGSREECPPELRGKILVRISREKRMRRLRIAVFGGLGLAAFLGIIPAWGEFTTEAAHSGFWNFMPLLFSDSGTIASAWQDFALAIAESFPAVGAAAVAVSVLMLLFSLRELARDISVSFRKSRFARV